MIPLVGPRHRRAALGCVVSLGPPSAHVSRETTGTRRVSEKARSQPTHGERRERTSEAAPSVDEAGP